MYVQVHSLGVKINAVNSAKKFEDQGFDARVFLSEEGRYIVALGPVSESKVRKLKASFLASGLTEEEVLVT